VARRHYYDALHTFAVIAAAGSFSQAARELGVSQSALSQSMRQLEDRLKLRLLARTSRSVSPTPAGERLLATLDARFQDIEDELDALRAETERPAGTIRITAVDYVARTLIWPRLANVLPNYPDLVVEVADDYSLTDLVAGRYDIGVRHGADIAPDMVAAPISGPVKIHIVGSPAYFQTRGIPRTRADLAGHVAVNLRLASAGGIYAWELIDEAGETVPTRVPSRAIFNNLYGILDAVRDGAGLGFLPDALVAPAIARGELRTVLDQHAPFFEPHHLFYPSRRQNSAALQVVVAALRRR
tara:strand:- start:216 stop:1112 length:897 start_codon:yes stop_codon:yes gene_type:complete